MVRILTIIAFLSITLTVHGQHEPDPYATARAEYRVRISKVAADDVPGLLAVATWCREAKLYGEMRKVAKKVVGIRPDHAQARTLLGEAIEMYRTIGMPKHMEMAEGMLQRIS